MVIGRGVHRMAGRGWDMNRGAGHPTTTAAGSTTTTTGPGVRAASTTVAAGGVQPSSPLISSASTSRGTRCHITTAILALGTFEITIGYTRCETEISPTFAESIRQTCAQLL